MFVETFVSEDLERPPVTVGVQYLMDTVIHYYKDGDKWIETTRYRRGERERIHSETNNYWEIQGRYEKTLSPEEYEAKLAQLEEQKRRERALEEIFGSDD